MSIFLKALPSKIANAFRTGVEPFRKRGDMSIIRKLLGWGVVGLAILSAIIILFILLSGVLSLRQLGSHPEIQNEMVYSIGDGQEKTISLSSGEEFPSEDIERLLEDGMLTGRLRVFSRTDSSLMEIGISASAPLNEIVAELEEAVFDAVLESTGRELAKEVLGEESQKTVSELIESPSENLVNFLGESYEEVLTELAEGNLGATIEEVLSEDLEEKAEKLPKETLGKAADEILGEDANMTLEEILESEEEEMQEVLGEEYEEKLADLFGEDTERTIRDVIVEDPGKLIEMIKDTFLDTALEELLSNQTE